MAGNDPSRHFTPTPIEAVMSFLVLLGGGMTAGAQIGGQAGATVCLVAIGTSTAVVVWWLWNHRRPRKAVARTTDGMDATPRRTSRIVGVILLAVLVAGCYVVDRYSFLAEIIPGRYPEVAAASVIRAHFDSLHRIIASKDERVLSDSFDAWLDTLSGGIGANRVLSAAKQVSPPLQQLPSNSEGEVLRWWRALDPNSKARVEAAFRDLYAGWSSVTLDGLHLQPLRSRSDVMYYSVVATYHGKCIADKTFEQMTVMDLAEAVHSPESQARRSISKAISNYYPDADLLHVWGRLGDCRLPDLRYRNAVEMIAFRAEIQSRLDKQRLQEGWETSWYSIKLEQAVRPSSASPLSMLRGLFHNPWRISAMGNWGMQRQTEGLPTDFSEQ